MKNPTLSVSRKVKTLWLGFMPSLALLTGIFFGGTSQASTEVQYTEASYYTVQSCIEESGQYRMSNGRLLDDTQKTFASWDYKFGQRCRITNLLNDRSCISVCTDRGPNRKLCRQGRRADCSWATMVALGGVEKGLIPVKIEVLK